ncbi:hypothetical protein ACHWQZ_G008749 [Mnemiopsis leidyi]
MSSRRNGGSIHAGDSYPYVLLVGQTGSGKSDIAKKLAHPEFVSSNIKGSGTQTSDLFWTYDRTMVICDVPEDQPGSQIFKGNASLALALTFEPVSRILVIVKAQADIYTVLENIKMYYNGFVSISYNLNRIVEIVITDMDKILTWQPRELISLIKTDHTIRLILSSILFTEKVHLRDSDNSLLRDIRGICVEKFTIPTSMIVLSDLVDSNLSGWTHSTIWQLNQLVEDFKRITQKFSLIAQKVEEQLTLKDERIKKGDILFEFQTWMKDRMFIAYNKLADKQNFSFEDETAELENVYLASMGNQMKHILFVVKMATKKYLVERDVDPRRCPYCNTVWTKIITENCDSATTCGTGNVDKTKTSSSVREYNFHKFGYYAFEWTPSRGLLIRPCTEVRSCNDHRNAGCGKSINWNEMPQIELPKKMMEVLATVLLAARREKFPKNEKISMPSETKVEPESHGLLYSDPTHSGKNPIEVEQKPSSIKVESESKEKIRGENYVVFIGDVGVGKSTVVGKLTGKQMESGDNKMSITRTSTAHWSYDGTVILSDTPGSNSLQDQLQHNEEIAAAFNYRPISRVIVVVKADIRIANVMRVVEKYSERLLSLPDENIGVLVTHMDTVSWTPRDLKQRVIDEYGIECVIFCGKETPKEILMGEIRRSCGRTISFRVNNKNFSELFKINNKMVKILKDTSKEIDGFTELKRQFKIIIEKDNALSKPAFIRDFQSWLQTQITEAEDRLAKSNNFTFSGEDAAKERGYIANLTNQIKVIFNEITSLNVVNDRANVGGNAGSVDYVFKWRNESEYLTFNTVERKEEGENMSLPIPRGTPQICRPKESETSNMVKRESLPPITPYSNDQEKNISKSLEGERANQHSSLSVMSSRLEIAPNKSQNSGTTHFTFELFEESSTGDSTIRFDESKKLVKNVDLPPSPMFKQQIPARKTQSSELKLDHPSNDKNDESRNEFPLFSFNIVFDQRNVGHDKRMYTLQLYEEGLKVIPIETQIDDRHDKSLKSSVPLEKDWSPGHWRNISVSFDNMDALSSHTGRQDIMETAGSCTDSGTPTRTYRKKSMLNHKPDNSKTVQERTRSKESIMSYYAHNFISGFRKNKNNIDDKRFKERQGPSALNSDQAEYNKGSFNNDGNFNVNVKNKNPDTPSFGIIFTPTPSTSSSRSGIDKLATALNDKCLLSNNQSKSTSLTCSRSSSRTTNLSGITGSRDSERKTSRARRSTKSRRSLI